MHIFHSDHIGQAIGSVLQTAQSDIMPYFTLFLLHNYFEVDSQFFECNIDSHLLHFSQGV